VGDSVVPTARDPNSARNPPVNWRAIVSGPLRDHNIDVIVRSSAVWFRNLATGLLTLAALAGRTNASVPTQAIK
jgi:hypothetical protein